VQLTDGAYFRDVVPLAGKARNERPRQLIVLYPKDRWWSVARQVASPILLAGAVTMLAAILVSVAVAARFVRPVRVLRNQADLIAAGRFQPVAVPRRNDEIGDLTVAINSMTEKLGRYELEVRRSERLRTLGQLGAGIAHQLRNAATAARMAVELFQRDRPDSAGDESLGMALRQLQLMESHLQRFLAVGRSEAAADRPVVLQEVVDEVIGLVRPACRHAAIELAVDCPDGDVIVRGDRQSLVQLLINLTLNAIDAAERYTDSQPRVHIEVAEIDGGGVMRIKDSGPGPDSAVANEVFEPFVTDKPDGTGLGLYVARQIVEFHHGKICWDRQDGMTCFTIELPAARIDPIAPEKA
jgi:signal transduction histidine kinase